MEYVTLKVLMAIGFFAALLWAAYWADRKMDEYWKDDEDGS